MPAFKMSVSRRIKSLEDSSARYGNCQKCGKHVAEVMLQVIELEYAPGEHAYITNFFGHRKCADSIFPAWTVEKCNALITERAALREATCIDITST